MKNVAKPVEHPYLLAKISADTAENEGNVAEFLPKIGNYPRYAFPAAGPAAARPPPPCAREKRAAGL